MSTTNKHASKDLGDRKGWFEKNMSSNPVGMSYRENCKGIEYNGSRWEAHHIIPQTSIYKSIHGVGSASGRRRVSSLESEKRAFLEQVKWITDWNIDETYNLTGMPHLNSFMMYFQGDQFIQDLVLEDEGEASNYLKTRYKSFNNKKKSRRENWRNQFGDSPEGYCIHNYVSWGHTDYNRNVANSLRALWKEVQYKKEAHAAHPEEHGVDPAKLAKDLKARGDAFKKILETRGKKATEENWHKRLDKDEKQWYNNFMMWKGWNPLTGKPN